MNEFSLSGKTLAQYRVIARLGAGGMGEVYKGYDTKLDRTVALKILHADKLDDKDRVRRFIQEAKAASALNHPHIITIYDIGQVQPTDGKEGEPSGESGEKDTSSGSASSFSQSSAGAIHYIAMEFIDGETLRSRIERKPVDLRKLFEILAQVADGLAAAHAVGIVHRDLKPENIMIRQDGYAKVVDFGLSKLTDIRSPLTRGSTQTVKIQEEHTEPGAMLGTVGYMSPEQVQGEAIDYRSDIFSFGCILHEAAAGKRAFEGDSFVDTLYKIVYGQAPNLRDSNPDAPVELQRIVRKCLAKDPDKRYQSMKDLAIDLRELKEEYERTHGYSSAGPLETVIDVGPPQSHASTVTAPLSRPRSFKVYLPLVAAGLVVLGTLIALPLLNRRSPTGKLLLQSSPAGARIFLNDEFFGSTPLPVKNLKPGVYKLRLELEGFESKVETLEVGDRSDLERSYLLHRLPTPPPAPLSTEKPPVPKSPAPAPTKAASPKMTAEKKVEAPARAPEKEKPKASVTNKVSRPTDSVEVKHGHGIFRKFCTGTLRIDGSEIEYLSSSTHSFKASLSGMRSTLLSKDRIAIHRTGPQARRIELQQVVRDASPGLVEINERIQEYLKAENARRPK